MLSLSLIQSTSVCPVTVCVPTVVISAVVNVPSIVVLPSTFKTSLMFTVVLSADAILLPLIVSQCTTTFPVPPGVILMSALDEDDIVL